MSTHVLGFQKRLKIFFFSPFYFLLALQSQGVAIIPPLQNALKVKGKLSKCHGSGAQAPVNDQEHGVTEKNQ